MHQRQCSIGKLDISPTIYTVDAYQLKIYVLVKNFHQSSDEAIGEAQYFRVEEKLAGPGGIEPPTP